MFRFPLRFTCILLILILVSICSSIQVSFGEPCSEDLPCIDPLICSNSSRCECSLASSFWHTAKEDCFYCLPGWIAWEQQRCISLAVPGEGGLSHELANQTCQSLSAQLLHISDRDEFERFETEISTRLRGPYSSAVTVFFRLGAWIDRSYPADAFKDLWCDQEPSHSAQSCVLLHRDVSTNDSLCLRQRQCDEPMPFICTMPAVLERDMIANGNLTSSNSRVAALVGALAPLAIDLVGNLFGGNKQPQQPTGPQQIIIQQESGPSPAPQAASSDNTLLYVGLGVGGFLLILLLCGGAIAIVFFTGCLKSPSSNQSAAHRSSMESGHSYI